VLVCESGKEREAMIRLARVGFENVVGYLDGGIDGWKNAGGSIQSIAAAEPSDMKGYIDQGYEILDVRKPGEFEIGHIKGAVNIHLQILDKELNQLDKNKNYLIHCAGGYRSMIACSIMKKHGFRNTINIYRGFNGILESAGLEIETGTCENTRRMQKLQA
jgi:rhodanese-related sulfurtransferase